MTDGASGDWPAEVIDSIRTRGLVIVDEGGIARARLGVMADGVELSLQPLKDKSFRSLSGGMKQKLLVALAFASDASLYMYGPAADALFAAVRPILERSPMMKGARVTLRYGRPGDDVPESHVTIT